jgi:hypothetical protein
VFSLPVARSDLIELLDVAPGLFGGLVMIVILSNHAVFSEIV